LYRRYTRRDRLNSKGDTIGETVSFVHEIYKERPSHLYRRYTRRDRLNSTADTLGEAVSIVQEIH